jgi:ectoine hydroxylase-related dioxygenase (phytanoyl-CoA dioxygenase family)
MQQGGGTQFNEWTVDWRPEPSAVATVRAPDGKQDVDVSPALVKEYEDMGVVRVPGLFKDWVKPLRAGLERILQAPESYAFPCESTAAGEPGRFFNSYCNWHRVPEFLDFLSRSPAAALAGKLMSAGSAQLFHEHVFAKEPGTAKATPWHQDMPYYCVDGPQTASVYVALDDTPPDVAVQFVAGSHRWDKLFFPRVFAGGEDFNTDDDTMQPVPDIEGERGRFDIVSWPLKAGDALVFDYRTLHGTTSGELKMRRRAFSARFLGDGAHYLLRPGELSPPLTDIGLTSGDILPGEWFPVAWSR